MCPTPSKVSSQLTKTTGCYVTCAFTNMPSYINKRRKNALYFACLLHVGPFNYFSEGSAVVQMFSSSKNSKFVLRGGNIFQNQALFLIFPKLSCFCKLTPPITWWATFYISCILDCGLWKDYRELFGETCPAK